MTASFMPFGTDYRNGVSLATGWLTGSIGGAERIVVGQLTGPGAVKVYSSGSALQGGPVMYLHSAMAHSPIVDFTEAASFAPFSGSAGVRVATTSTTTGADLLVSGVSAEDKTVQVLKSNSSDRLPTRSRFNPSRSARSSRRRARCRRHSAAIDQSVSGEASTLLLCARVRPGNEPAFAQWQVRWQSAVLASAGAVSVEFGHRRRRTSWKRWPSLVSRRSMRCGNGGAATAIANSSTRRRRWSKAAW